MSKSFITVQAAGRAIEQLSLLVEKIEDMQPVLRDIGALLESNAQIRFDTKKDPAGRPWSLWAEATRVARESENRGTLLNYTGRMRTSLTHQVVGNVLEIGFGVPYARFHETGTSRMPSRPTLLTATGKIGPEDESDIVRVVGRYLT
jgi:phage virion morphogenesis protein